MNNKKKNKKSSVTKKSAAKKQAAEKIQEDSQFDPTAPLMPELEELVKKNPNRLIGCGG